jgi:hypothetical protein
LHIPQKVIISKVYLLICPSISQKRGVLGDVRGWASGQRGHFGHFDKAVRGQGVI